MRKTKPASKQAILKAVIKTRSGRDAEEELQFLTSKKFV